MADETQAVEPTERKAIVLGTEGTMVAKTHSGVPYDAKTKFTEETKNVILGAVRAGNHFSTAAAIAGVSYACFHRWKKLGEIPEDEPGYRPEYHDFYLALQKAEADCEQKQVKVWVTAAKEDWKAAAQFLANRYPERWSPHRKVEISGPGGAPIEFTIDLDTNVQDVDVETLQQIEERASNRGRELVVATALAVADDDVEDDDDV